MQLCNHLSHSCNVSLLPQSSQFVGLDTARDAKPPGRYLNLSTSTGWPYLLSRGSSSIPLHHIWEGKVLLSTPYSKYQEESLLTCFPTPYWTRPCTSLTPAPPSFHLHVLQHQESLGCARQQLSAPANSASPPLPAHWAPARLKSHRSSPQKCHLPIVFLANINLTLEIREEVAGLFWDRRQAASAHCQQPSQQPQASEFSSTTMQTAKEEENEKVKARQQAVVRRTVDPWDRWLQATNIHPRDTALKGVFSAPCCYADLLVQILPLRAQWQDGSSCNRSVMKNVMKSVMKSTNFMYIWPFQIEKLQLSALAQGCLLLQESQPSGRAI